MAKKQAFPLPEADYYFLELDLSRKAIGKYPPTKFVPEGMDASFYEKPNSMTKLRPDKYPDYEPELIWEIQEKSKLTDVIDAGNIRAKGMLISDRLYVILRQFTIVPHRFYKAIVIHHGVRHNYWGLYFLVRNNETDIDFTKSIFTLKHNSLKVYTNYNNSIDLENEIKTEGKSMFALKAESIFL